MKLFGSHAHGAELAKLLADVLRQTGHLKAEPADLQELIKAANGVITAGGDAPVPPAAAKSYVQTVPDHCDRIIWRGDYVALPMNRSAHTGTPVFVVETEGGTLLKTSGTHAAHLIFIDTDTEGSDPDQVVHVLGADHHVTHHLAEVTPASALLVDQVLTDITAADEAAEAARPLPRYVVGLNWKDFLFNMEDEQCMRIVYDTQTKQIAALHLETEAGYVLAPAAVVAEALDTLLKSDDAFANPYSYGLEYVDEIPAWAKPAASLALPEPVVFFALRNHDGPPQYSPKAVQEHAIAYEPGYTPSIGDLPDLPAPAYPGLPAHGVEPNFSKDQLIEYRELAAEMDRRAYAHAQIEAVDEEETDAPRG
jgi:hypothetical protein